VAITHERGDLGTRSLARIDHHNVEREIGDGSLRVAQPALYPAPQGAVLLVDHRDDGRDAARDRGAGTVLEVVERREGRRRREMRVQINTSGEHKLAERVDLARCRLHVTDRGDVLACDRDIRATLAVRCDDDPAAHDEVGQSPSSSRRDIRSAWSSSDSASTRSSMSPSIRRSRFERLWPSRRSVRRSCGKLYVRIFSDRSPRPI
jgi:hypothetical protein